MEEVDDIIMRQLRDIDCDFDEEKRTLRDLIGWEVIGCMLRCLSLILPDQQMPPTPGPSDNMAIKYQTANFIACKCKDLGFRGDLGYQSFLYGSESDTRNVFLFLMEKLPKDSTTAVSVPKELTVMDRFASSSEHRCHWLPPMHPVPSREQMHAVPIAGILNAKSIFADRMAPNKRQYYDLFARIPFHDVYSISQSYQNATPGVRYSIRRLPITTSSKTMSFHRENEITSSQSESVIKDHGLEVGDGAAHAVDQVMEKQGTEVQTLEAELSAKIAESDTCRHTIGGVRKAIIELETCLKEEQVRLLELRSHNLSLDELKDVEQEAEQDLQQLKGKWDHMRQQLHQEIKELTAVSSKSAEYQRLISETKTQIRDKRKEIESKSEIVHQLRSQVPNEMPPTRNSYTKRILEIINNIKKQDTETKKLMTEMRSLQKEISLLTGKVSRCFSLADEAIFSQAKSDDFSRRSYKLLVSMHQECNKLSQLIESTGLVRREVLKLEESVQRQTALDIGTKLAQISEDYKQLKQSNKEMMLQLQEKRGEGDE